jgi:hypothetical protein
LRAGRQSVVRRFLDLADVTFFDQVRDRARVDHDLDGRLAPPAGLRAHDTSVCVDRFHMVLIRLHAPT